MRRLVVVFDVSGLEDDEVAGLGFEIEVQAEASERHPDVPVVGSLDTCEPDRIASFDLAVTRPPTEHERGFEAGYRAAIHDAGVEGSRAHHEIERRRST